MAKSRIEYYYRLKLCANLASPNGKKNDYSTKILAGGSPPVEIEI
jgi:hypothetical protein